jgi:hypothetical protein
VSLLYARIVAPLLERRLRTRERGLQFVEPRGRVEDVPPVVELGDGDPVSELSQAGEAATSGAAVVMGL